MFGSSNNKPLFGSSGTSSAFGQPNTSTFGVQPTPGGGLFGSMTATQTPQQTGLFGSTATQPFGSTQTSIFGTTPNTVTTNTFGSQSAPSAFGGTTSSIFGTTQQNNSLFGGNRFGTTSTTSPFGNTSLTQPMSAPNGTTIKFNAPAGTDTMMKNGVSQNINTRHQCITCMREYETKSLEELRLEDYIANRKGPQNPGMFGTAASSVSSGGLFGSTPTTQNTFGATTQNTGLFGPNKTAFGGLTQPTTTSSAGLFGQNTFGQNKPMFGGSSTFPSAVTPSSTTSIFGPTSTANPLQNNSFFGSTSNTAAVKPTFGTTATPTQPTLFGNTQNNSLAPKPLFGTTPTSSATPFGANTGNTLFNTGNAGSTLFGSTSQPSLFSTPSNFNNTLNKPLINFNTTPANPFNSSLGGTGLTSTTSLFGTNTNQFGNTGTSLFNSSAPSFNFGSTNPTFQSSLQPNMGATTQLPLQTTVQGVNTDQLVTRFQTFPYGNSPQLQIDVTISPDSRLRTKFTTDPKTLNQYKMSAKTIDNKPQRIVTNSSKVNTMLFDGLEDENTDDFKTAKDIFVPRKNVKKLVFKPKSTSSMADLNTTQNTSNTSSFMIHTEPQTGHKFEDSSVVDITVNEFILKDNNSKQKERLTISPAKGDESQTLNASIGSTQQSLKDDSDSESIAPIIPKCGVILTRTDYYTIPSIDELDAYYDPCTDTCVIPTFTVVRQDYGSIYWDGHIDVKGLNLDETVHIRRKEVIVYPDEEAAPKVGDGLNRAAQITLHQVWPIDKTTHEVIKDKDRLRAMKYSEKIEMATIKLGATFKEYRPDTGSWVFTVKHFSKYGLLDDDDDDDDLQVMEATKQILPKQSQQQQQQTIPSKEVLEPKRKLFSRDVELNDNYNMSYEWSDNLMKPKDNEMVNLFDDEYDDFFDEDLDQSASYLPPIVPQFTEVDKIRSTLFDQRDYESVLSKKSKTFAVISPQKEIKSKYVSPQILRPNPIIKREITFEADVFSAKNKIICDIGSVCMSNSPKLSFFNGSRNFTIVKGSTVLICSLNLIKFNDLVNNRFEEHLKKHSMIQKPEYESKAPVAETREFASNSHNSLKQEQLIEALYGPLSEATPYASYQQRLDKIKGWLFAVNKKLPIPKTNYSKIIHFLSTNELEVAAEEALNGNNPRLATLLACGPTVNKEQLIAQLDSWKRSKADNFIDYDLIKIYVLLSGLIEWKLSNEKIVKVLDGFQWTQQLALILLYKTQLDVDNNDLDLDILLTSMSSLTEHPEEVEYHLLAGHTPWVAMCMTSSPLDSWFLHESLKCYHVMKDENDLISMSDCIHTFIASQIDDIRWSCFVAIHISNDNIRQMVIKDIIGRKSSQFMQNKEIKKWLLDNLLIPTVFLAEAKAIQAKKCFDFPNLAENLIDCKQWSEAHEVLIESVFPQMVVNEENDVIADLISKLKPNCHLISNWSSNGAHIYDTYLKCLKNSNIEDIKAFNIHQLRTKCKTQILCQSEMARRVDIIYSELTGGQFAYNTPVPDDYALMELKMNAKNLTKLLCQTN
ncbi:nuclear pore complex protein Nup98-Nup96-like [Oppia nitens]|uniref:nuclear pore complex protein Nup98-Nup96-like n=1 Tax=Oppia nitens TaxID=1686743 RepID=UPI0023DBD755|nr:nuclear pore complex protein Nup98-Nup96-like [Oppia nitens]